MQKVPIQRQPLIRAFFRVKLGGEDVIARHGAGKGRAVAR